MYLAPSPSQWGQLLELSKHSMWIQPASKAIQMPFPSHTSNKQIYISCVFSTIQDSRAWLFLKAKLKPHWLWFFFFFSHISQSFFSENILSWEGLTKTTKSNFWPCTGKPQLSPQQTHVLFILQGQHWLQRQRNSGCEAKVNTDLKTQAQQN